MAEKKKEDLVLLPEERHAVLFRRELGIEGSVDIYSTAKSVAILELEPLPNQIDGITIGAKSSEPKILVSTLISESRRRFTIAHELGHIVLPWHVGTILSHVESKSSQNYEYLSLEAEANRFAAELLIPKKETAVRFARLGTPAKVQHELVRQTGLSATAVALGVCNSLPSGYAFAIMDRNGLVQFSGRSRGTIAMPIDVGEVVDPTKVLAFPCDIETIDLGDRRLVWWDLNSIERQFVRVPAKANPKDILHGIFRDLGLQDSEMKKIQNRIGGVIGACFGGGSHSDWKELYMDLVTKFSTRLDYADVVRHKDFRNYLTAQSKLLMSRSD